MEGPELAHEIRDGRIVTTIGGTPFDVVLYKLGERHLASRSDEYGFANCEVAF